jgi:hypothetical protein
MYCPILVRTTTLSRLTSISQALLRRALCFTLIVVALASVALPRIARAVTPAPDGGYPNGNTAEGTNALLSLTSGSFNTANGFAALSSNTIGIGNSATGVNALVSNGSGSLNTATGVSVLFSNTIGNNNTASGFAALFSNATGNDNTAEGFEALRHNTSGIQNVASGSRALSSNNTGNGNSAEGAGALGNNTGSFNTAVGFNAGGALTDGHDNVDIQAVGVAGESNTMRIGTVKQTATFISGIDGVTVPNGVGVIIDSKGQLGTVQSSARFKEAIKPMDKASEAILALKPVTFRYKETLDPDGIPQFGLIAEQVEKVNPDLVVRGEDGKVMTVRYEAVNAMLLNEFLKEHRKVEEQGATIAQMKKQIEALTATVQRVSDQVAIGKPAPQLVTNP